MDQLIETLKNTFSSKKRGINKVRIGRGRWMTFSFLINGRN